MTGQLIVLDRRHAKISPSMFERVQHCTASIPLTDRMPARLAGPAAQVGTAAHALLERCLREGLDTFELSDLQTVKVDGAEIPITEEMLDQVQLALRWIRANMPPPLLIEKQVTLGFTIGPEFAQPRRPPMSGWIDVACGPPWIVADYKSGFHSVEASSIQLGLYLLGLALEERPKLDGEGHAGTAVIIQPRDPEPVRSHAYTWKDLLHLRRDVANTFNRIDRRDWTYAFGDWCRFCPAAGVCPHLAAMATDPALTTLVPTAELVATGVISAAKLDAWLKVIPIFDHWARAATQIAEAYLIEGGRLPNHKLVAKRTNRRFKDDDAAAAAALTKLGVDPYMPPKLVSPAEAERRLPPTRRKLIAPLVEKPPGELTIAVNSDSRPGVDVHETLRNALQSSIAAGYLETAKSRT